MCNIVALMEPIELMPNWEIPASELQVRFVRSSGPGGQNVNKVATKVELRFSLGLSRCLTEGQKERLRRGYPSLATRSGELLLSNDEFRSQVMNLEAVRKRLKLMILRVRLPPTPRRATRPSRAAKKRRLSDKRHRSQVKKLRRSGVD